MLLITYLNSFNHLSSFTTSIIHNLLKIIIPDSHLALGANKICVFTKIFYFISNIYNYCYLAYLIKLNKFVDYLEIIIILIVTTTI